MLTGAWAEKSQRVIVLPPIPEYIHDTSEIPQIHRQTNRKILKSVIKEYFPEPPCQGATRRGVAPTPIRGWRHRNTRKKVHHFVFLSDIAQTNAICNSILLWTYRKTQKKILPGLIAHGVCKREEFRHLLFLRTGQFPALLHQSFKPDETEFLFP